jgi:hypothetical protein
MGTVTLNQIHEDLGGLKKDVADIKNSMNNLKQLEEDLVFARKTEEAYKELERGEGIKIKETSDDVIDEMDKW